MSEFATFSNFESIADFKWSLENGGEIEFEWNGKQFGVFKYMKKTPDSPEQIFIGPSDATEKSNPGKYPKKYMNTIDETLDYVIDGESLKSIITKVDVLWRNI